MALPIANPILTLTRDELLSLVTQNFRDLSHAEPDLQQIWTGEFTEYLNESPEIVEFAMSQSRIVVPLTQFYHADPARRKTKVNTPVREAGCKHVEVFDLDYYLDRLAGGHNECPICGRKVNPLLLYVDLLIKSNVESLGEEAALLLIPTDPDGGKMRYAMLEACGISRVKSLVPAALTPGTSRYKKE